MYPAITLKPYKEVSLVHHHPWVYSGAIDKLDPSIKHGDLVTVLDCQQQFLGIGTYSSTSSIAIRLVSYQDIPIDLDFFIDKITKANKHRLFLGLGEDKNTTGYRLFYSESDGVPGLIIDRYQNTLVMQTSTAGLENLKPQIIEALKQLFPNDNIVEKNDSSQRAQEKLAKVIKNHVGEVGETVQFNENGFKFYADIIHGQKTGFFLDQKDCHQALSQYCPGKSVLNLFSYTGAASVYALKNGAQKVINVDSSQKALELSYKNHQLNTLDDSLFTNIEADVFQYLDQHQEEKFDLIILDPPALIKSRKDYETGKKAYHFLNRAALRMLNPNGILVTSSCSRYLTKEDLLLILRKSSIQNQIPITVIKTIYQSSDHPLSVYFPESMYLKSFIIKI